MQTLRHLTAGVFHPVLRTGAKRLCAAMVACFLMTASLPAQDPVGRMGVGRIDGTVRFTGAVPPPEKIITSDGVVLMHSDLVVDAKTKGLRDVAVYLDAPAKAAKAPTAKALAKDGKPVTIDQRDMVFMPRVVAVQDGQTVRFENNDLSNHAVQAMSLDTRNVFNVLTPMGQPFEFKFVAQKGPVHIGCPIHMWMRAWIYVLPHPWSAVTDAQGRFRIDAVPAGAHKLVLVHPDTKLRELRTITVEAGKTARVTLEWTRAGK